MSEYDTIQKVEQFNSVESFVRDFRELGLTSGMTVIVHSSLSAMGWVCGGAVSVVLALMEVITEDGTIVMPTHSNDLSDPAPWQLPPVPQAWWDEIRATMPAFDPHMTPTRGMGKIVEVFRTSPDVRRSYHPALSFAAWGKYAEHITANHSLELSLGEQSPLARIYDLNGHVLLLGVDYDRNTSFHLAEHRITKKTYEMQGAPIMENGERVWKSYREIVMNTDRFVDLGRDFEQHAEVTIGTVGAATARLFNQRQAVDYAQQWLERDTTVLCEET